MHRHRLACIWPATSHRRSSRSLLPCMHACSTRLFQSHARMHTDTPPSFRPPQALLCKINLVQPISLVSLVYTAVVNNNRYAKRAISHTSIGCMQLASVIYSKKLSCIRARGRYKLSVRCLSRFRPPSPFPPSPPPPPPAPPPAESVPPDMSASGYCPSSAEIAPPDFWHRCAPPFRLILSPPPF